MWRMCAEMGDNGHLYHSLSALHAHYAAFEMVLQIGVLTTIDINCNIFVATVLLTFWLICY